MSMTLEEICQSVDALAGEYDDLESFTLDLQQQLDCCKEELAKTCDRVKTNCTEYQIRIDTLTKELKDECIAHNMTREQFMHECAARSASDAECRILRDTNEQYKKMFDASIKEEIIETKQEEKSNNYKIEFNRDAADKIRSATIQVVTNAS